MPEAVSKTVERIGENCEPALCTVLFMGGAGGSLRAGVTENPVHLTRSVKQALTRVTCGGAPVYVWPGGGITFMVDVTQIAEERLRLRAHAGTRRAYRVHHVAPATMPPSAAIWIIVRSAETLREVDKKREEVPHAANPWPLGKS